ncbi:putative transmembrane protein [Heterostelium album PN500]|uniref:Putative transmembrane protein n=1 Tax=Heterostelium pallidum (strain ATCC 26659 / Pp 5 / PN500) TaxID=670386 RepID=D3AW99_HETP5|nr:putative transmembrane protein [Heterostelium album PN500]EFA86572.1 putative transmembrane protein [Heterostelium album PN500]|eukprot:XP_020438677.1 putative transmembrane protein [Heterostelium album PN500]
MSYHNKINILRSTSVGSQQPEHNTPNFNHQNTTNFQMNNNTPTLVGSYPSYLAPLEIPPPLDQSFDNSNSSTNLIRHNTITSNNSNNNPLTASENDISKSTATATTNTNRVVDSFDFSMTDQSLSESVSPRRLSQTNEIEMESISRNSCEMDGAKIDDEPKSFKGDIEENNYDPFDPYHEKLYTIEDVGWKGKQTIKLMFQRYFLGLIVAIFVSLVVFIMSQVDWSGDSNANVYLNRKSYHIFFQFAIGISYWFYFIDAFGVVVMYTCGEVIFAYSMSMLLQSETGKQPDKKKAYGVAYNYCAPDIFVTVFTVIYMFFLLPIYFSIESDILRLGWRLVIHPIYWTAIIVVARQFLTRDISTDDIMLNTNIVLHTFFHHQTLGKIFVYTFSSDAPYLTEVGMIVSALEDIILRALALKRDEIVLSFYYGKERARQIVYSQQSLQLRAAILNIQVALEFSGLISAPIFIYLFQKWKMLFHFFDTGAINPVTLFYQSVLSIGLDLIAEFVCTFIETKYFKLPLEPTWKWMKSHKWFLAWLVYGSITMGLFGMLWTCARVPRAGLCSADDICTCNQIISSSIPDFCKTNSTIIPLLNTTTSNFIF